MKLTADTVNGLTVVDDFELSVEVLSENVFLMCLKEDFDGFIGSEVSDATAKKLEEEYNVTSAHLRVGRSEGLIRVASTARRIIR